MPRPRPRRHQSLFKDKAVDLDQWAYIRSWRRHLPDQSWLVVITGFWPIVAWLTFLAVLWSLYKSVAVPRFGAPDWPPPYIVTTIYQPFSITSFALALLMVFRTNSSYARWWEARSTWGQVFNVSRNLVRQAAAFIGPEHEAAFQTLCRWSAALGFILKAHLEGSSDVDDALRELLTTSELALLASWKHRPNCAAQVLSTIVQRTAHDNPQLQMAMDDQIATYINDAGACERIMKTSIPTCYTRHTSRFLLIWLSFLPVALYDICGWASPGVEAVLAFLLIGVENIGIQIEEPFTVLPMGSFSRVIAQNALEVAEQREGLEESVEHFFSQRNGFKGEQSLPSDGAREMNGNGGETHKRSPGEDLQASGSALDPLAALEQGEGDKVDLRRLA